jgi:hypothetical protein
MENNLDQLCFSKSIEIAGHLKDLPQGEKKKKAKELENFIQKSLGVVQEDGVFAFFIYLKANDKSCIDAKIENNIIQLLNITIGKRLDTSLEKIKNLGDDINVLLLAKSLIEKTLIYARYQAKSMGG